MNHEEDGAHFYSKIGMTVSCLQCGKMFYFALAHKPEHCPKCGRLLSNKYRILKEHYEKG